VRMVVSEICWRGPLKSSLKVGDEVTLLAPHVDAGAKAVVRILDVGGAMVELIGGEPCYTWAGTSSLRKRPGRAGTQRPIPPGTMEAASGRGRARILTEAG